MHLFNRFNDALDKDLSDSFYLSEEKYLQFWYARGTSFLVFMFQRLKVWILWQERYFSRRS